MNIYKYEIDAGLGEKIKNNAIAYSSEIVSVDYPEIDIKAIAQEQEKNPNIDLFHFKSVLASTGWNANDDVFDLKELWKAKDTPVFKKVNHMHEETEVRGVIVASVPIANGKIIDQPVEDYDIVISSYLYKFWEDEDLQEQMNLIIESITKGSNEWFVSMECIFRNFDYALTKGSENYVVTRNEKTSFLTKYLRRYGGPGEYQGYKIGRLLRDFTFSGVGLVKNPANKRSVILNTFNAKAELIMEDKNYEIELANKDTELSKAYAKIEKLQEDLQSKVEAAAKAEKDKLVKDIEKLNLTIAEEKEEKEKVKKELDEKEKKLDEVTKASKVLEDELTKIKSELEKAAAEKKLAERRSQLVTAGVEDVENILSAWASATDEQFSQIVELVKAKTASTTNESETTDFSKASIEDTNIPNITTEDNQEVSKAAITYFTELFTKDK